MVFDSKKNRDRFVAENSEDNIFTRAITKREIKDYIQFKVAYSKVIKIEGVNHEGYLGDICYA